MNITLSYADLQATVERSLSVIGKRSTDDNGKRIFTDITLGSREKEIIHDFFRQAVIDLSAETAAFITAESTTNGNNTSATRQISFWTNQAPSNFTSQVTENGQLLYNYESRKLYKFTLTFLYNQYAPSATDLFKYNGRFYKSVNNTPTPLTAEEVAALTDAQKAAAKVVISYNAGLPQPTEADIYVIHNNSLYRSRRVVDFSEETILTNVTYYTPTGYAYQWQYGTMQRVIDGNDEAVSITLTFPTNHNSILEKFIHDSCKAYCVSYALYSWFTVTAPRIAGKYLEDCKRQLSAVIRLVYDKKAPQAPENKSPLVITTIIS